jgi:hypothetical protein
MIASSKPSSSFAPDAAPVNGHGGEGGVATAIIPAPSR